MREQQLNLFQFQIKDGFQDQFKKSFEPIELEGKLKEEEYDTENVTVQIVELSTDEIAKSNNWIGANRPVYEGEQSGEEEESSSEEEEEEQIPGFTVTSTKPSKKKKPTTEVENSTENGDTEGTTDDSKPKKKFKKIPEEIKSKRALGQYFAKRATNSLKHSKAYQMKNKLEGNKNRKKARVEKEKRIKLQNKREKHKKNSIKSVKKTKTEKKQKGRNHKK